MLLKLRGKLKRKIEVGDNEVDGDAASKYMYSAIDTTNKKRKYRDGAT